LLRDWHGLTFQRGGSAIFVTNFLYSVESISLVWVASVMISPRAKLRKGFITTRWSVMVHT
jgi:hypothetical protein